MNNEDCDAEICKIVVLDGERAGYVEAYYACRHNADLKSPRVVFISVGSVEPTEVLIDFLKQNDVPVIDESGTLILDPHTFCPCGRRLRGLW